MIRAVVAAVAVLIFSAATALSFQTATDVQVAIDVNTSGNSASALGVEDACLSVNVGDSFDIDIVVKGVPPLGSAPYGLGLAGYGYNLKFDPGVVHVTGAQNNFMMNAPGPFDRIVANFVSGADPNPLPATTGNMRVDFLDLSEDYEDGDGVLSRLTLQAAGAGTTTLHLDSAVEQQPAPVIFAAGGFPYGISQLQDAVINVGTPCESAALPTPFDPPDTYVVITPAPTPSGPTPTPTLGPDGIDEGDAEVSVDAITTGNGATTVDDIDDCAAADIGQTFAVDLVIEDVEDMLGWEAPVSFDPAVLKIVDRDVKLFLGANSGSRVFDASNQTPNTTGIYRSAAVDQADPAASESGDGVLMRLTLQAIGAGTSKVSVSPLDLNLDGQTDTGVLLKNTDNQAIGGQIFRGPTRDAEIRVGTACSGGGHVAQPEGDDGVTEGDDDGNSWILIVAGAAIAALAVGAGAVLFMRRRAGGGTPA